LRAVGALRGAATGNPGRSPAVWAMSLGVWPQRGNSYAGEVLNVDPKQRPTEIVLGKGSISRPAHFKSRGGNGPFILSAPKRLLSQGSRSILGDKPQDGLCRSQQSMHVSSEITGERLREVIGLQRHRVRGLSAKQPRGKAQRTR